MAGQADKTGERTEGMGKALKRRGILAAAGAAMAGIVATKTSVPVRAVSGSFDNFYVATGGNDGINDADFVAGGTNPVGFDTRLGTFGTGVYAEGTSTGVDAKSSSGTGVKATSVSGDGVYATTGGTGSGIAAVVGFNSSGSGAGVGVLGNTGQYGIGVKGGDKGLGGGVTTYGIGVQGRSDTGYGVHGVAGGGSGVRGESDSGYGVYVTGGSFFSGVYGVNTSVGNAGVEGRNENAGGFGVFGHGGPGGRGVYGTIATGTGTGVEGVYSNSAANGVGVRGRITLSSGAGGIAVYGENTSTNTGGVPGNGGFGVYGYSAKGHGLVGATGTAGGGAVVGATNGVAGAYAAIFYGPVAMTGGKSAAVKNADGSHSLLYCEESPESWFADYGKGTLTGGKAEVKIDPGFAAVADMRDYHVFLTAYGDFHVHVTGQQADRFAVQQTTGAGSASASGTFSYRIVGKRKDIEGKRLAKVFLPPEPPVATPSVPAPVPNPQPAQPSPVTPPVSASPVIPPATATPGVPPAPNPLPPPRP